MYVRGAGEWRDGGTCRAAPCVAVTCERSPKELLALCMCVVPGAGEWRDGGTCRAALCVAVTGERSPKELLALCMCRVHSRI